MYDMPEHIPDERKESLGTIRFELMVGNPVTMRAVADLIEALRLQFDDVRTEMRYGNDLTLFRVKSEDEVLDEAGKREQERREADEMRRKIQQREETAAAELGISVESYRAAQKKARGY